MSKLPLMLMNNNNNNNKKVEHASYAYVVNATGLGSATTFAK